MQTPTNAHPGVVSYSLEVLCAWPHEKHAKKLCACQLLFPERWLTHGMSASAGHCLTVLTILDWARLRMIQCLKCVKQPSNLLSQIFSFITSLSP